MNWRVPEWVNGEERRTIVFLIISGLALGVSFFLPEPPKKLIISGGGANNPTMVRFIRRRLPDIEVTTGREIGWNCEAMEAQAFAYLAVRRLAGLPITFPTTTGVSEPLPGGEIHTPGKK